MNFNLESNEAQFILQVLAQLPTQTGAFPLYQKWENQFKAQHKPVPVADTELSIVEE